MDGHPLATSKVTLLRWLLRSTPTSGHPGCVCLLCNKASGRPCSLHAYTKFPDQARGPSPTTLLLKHHLPEEYGTTHLCFPCPPSTLPLEFCIGTDLPGASVAEDGRHVSLCPPVKPPDCDPLQDLQSTLSLVPGVDKVLSASFLTSNQ